MLTFTYPISMIMASSDQQKQKIKEHLSRSLSKFTQTSTTSAIGLSSSAERKQRIMDHIKLSSG